MEYLHVIKIEKHNPGYKDRESKWLKFHFSAMNENQYTRLCEIDQNRFMHFIRLEIQTKRPVLLDNKYLKKQGFNLFERRLASTIHQLLESKLVKIRTQADIEQEENRTGTEQEQNRNRIGTEQEQESGCVGTKGLTKKSVTQRREEKRRVHKKKHIVKMTPPTLEELSQYIREKGYQVDAQYFHDYFTTSGWVDGQGSKVKNWKQKVISWNNRNAQKNKQSGNRDEDGYHTKVQL